MEQRVEVELNRCLCVHSLLQFVDVTIRTILYDRKIIPQPVQHLQQNEDVKSQQFCESYLKITEVLRHAFRSANSAKLKEVVMLLGNTPHQPSEIIRIDVQPCEQHDDDALEELITTTACKPMCGTLSRAESMSVFRALACGSANEVPIRLGKMAKAFIFVRTRGELMQIVDDLDPDEDYGLPNTEQMERMKIRTTWIASSKCSPPSNDRKNADVGGEPLDYPSAPNSQTLAEAEVGSHVGDLWHRIPHLISSLNIC